MAGKKLLTQELKKQEALERISKSQDYQEYLKPILESAVKNKWLDPSEFKSLEEFHKAYSESFGRASAFRELMMILDNAGTMARNISEQMSKPKKNYASI